MLQGSKNGDWTGVRDDRHISACSSLNDTSMLTNLQLKIMSKRPYRDDSAQTERMDLLSPVLHSLLQPSSESQDNLPDNWLCPTLAPGVAMLDSGQQDVLTVEKVLVLPATTVQDVPMTLVICQWFVCQRWPGLPALPS